jgi:hypothetical protein
MSGQQSGPVVCISYLAAASLWNVAHFPTANQGAEIRAIEQSIAADAPMAAAVLAAGAMSSPAHSLAFFSAPFSRQNQSTMSSCCLPRVSGFS